MQRAQGITKRLTVESGPAPTALYFDHLERNFHELNSHPTLATASA